MSAVRSTPSPAPAPSSSLTFDRLLDEGHSTRAWYGADLLTAVGDVTADQAARRPAPGRHTIGEVALHHAYWATEARRRLTGATADFPLAGEDWFTWPGPAGLDWDGVRQVLTDAVRALYAAADDVAASRVSSPLSEEAQADLLLGITAHAAYHAGQIQLLKRLV